ncbi:hypothetical protein [Labilibacter marinus]|uniref:hypothetical protein n=1 Tax=Labilibacter marinus TaxID=1477105 RepID=UPI00082B49B4|nr:hypothetical protein [Labilibacter marinus]
MQDSFYKIVVLVITLNLSAYLIKYILKTKGYPINWFSGYVRDICNLWKLFIKTKKIIEKLIYFILGTAFPLLTIVFITSVFSYTNNFSEVDRCEYEEQFRQTQWAGIISNKYIDKINHSYKTIEIENDGKLQKIQNWVLFQNGNFEQIEIGDSMVKTQGLVNVKLFKNDKELELIVDYGCDESNTSNN